MILRFLAAASAAASVFFRLAFISGLHLLPGLFRRRFSRTFIGDFVAWAGLCGHASHLFCRPPAPSLGVGDVSSLPPARHRAPLMVLSIVGAL